MASLHIAGYLLSFLKFMFDCPEQSQTSAANTIENSKVFFPLIVS